MDEIQIPDLAPAASPAQAGREIPDLPRADILAAEEARVICPQCRGEFVDGVEVCADCEVPLVPAPPEPDRRFASSAPRESQERWVVLFQTAHLIEADLAGAALEEAGIPYHQAEADPGELTLDLPLPASHGPGNWWVIHVPETRADEARSVLERQPAPPDEPLEERHDPASAARKRGFTNLALAYLVLLGLFVVWAILSLTEWLFP